MKISAVNSLDMSKIIISQRAIRLICLLMFYAGGTLIASQKNEANAESSLDYLTAKPIGLGIHGFNYTDLVIEWFSINGRGGGNIAVSSPTSGGGGTTCCFPWRAGRISAMKVEIEWMRIVNQKRRWCKKTTMIQPPFPDKPFAVAVHFMPDGSIISEITSNFPKTKLQLERYDPGHRKESGNAIHDEEVAECRHVY
ncbi:DUF3304 domain-containing protein [Azohydromonas lata]|uniref:DUF3304 domain-containing protein n=1 Tax=Azohydromonas lata TaxID=45677 RepID=A0ABU5IC97_9BURK|nr:DUF3304 domain-containing protein [Azohydromonas lata]MDZ5456593.1 DUF3304 domain-containing protein [Azohydromonas lata]